METEKNKEMWRLAKKRVGFKKHLLMYIIVNLFFWAIWFFDKDDDAKQDFPWPIWPMLGWGIGLAFEYVSVYINNKPNAVEREYEKLKNKE